MKTKDRRESKNVEHAANPIREALGQAQLRQKLGMNDMFNAMVELFLNPRPLSQAKTSRNPFGLAIGEGGYMQDYGDEIKGGRVGKTVRGPKDKTSRGPKKPPLRKR